MYLAQSLKCPTTLDGIPCEVVIVYKFVPHETNSLPPNVTIVDCFDVGMRSVWETLEESGYTDRNTTLLPQLYSTEGQYVRWLDFGQQLAASRDPVCTSCGRIRQTDYADSCEKPNWHSKYGVEA